MSYILLALLVYLLYRFIVGFVLPVYRTTSQVRKQFNDLHQKMQEQQNPHQPFNPSANGRPANSIDQRPKYDMEGEYISFEENPKN